jgi:hypothetical protein
MDGLASVNADVRCKTLDARIAFSLNLPFGRWVSGAAILDNDLVSTAIARCDRSEGPHRISSEGIAGKIHYPRNRGASANKHGVRAGSG